MSAAALNSDRLEDELHGTPDPGLADLGPLNAVTAAGFPLAVPTSSALPEHVKTHLIGGTSALGLGVAIERGTGFLANILAARFAGASNFGAYSLAISTANQISTYAAGGIGATATRFSGKYPFSSRGYSSLARALMIVSLVSASLAAGGLWFGSGAIANLLGKTQLTYLLRWSALSAAGIILLECARGFFVGQRRLVALLLLSVLVGGGMITLLPLAARMHSPTRMIISQGATTSIAVAVCLLFARRLRLHNSAAPSATIADNNPAKVSVLAWPLPLGPMLREVWSFGAVQLAGLVASNFAGWWLITLVARNDSSLVQMSFFAIASQWRNMAGLAPSLLTEGSYAVMSDPAGQTSSTPQRVMALCSFASVGLALLLAAGSIIIVPWVLTLLYGQAYRAASVTVAVALAIAVVHMGNAPAAARLTIVSIRATGVINTIWAVFVAGAGTLLLLHKGTAWQAMAVYFAAHVLSSTLVLLTLQRKDVVPPGLVLLFIASTLGSAAFAGLAVLRGSEPALTAWITGGMLLLLLLLAATLFFLGRRFRWLPSPAAVVQAAASLRGRFGKAAGHV